MATSMGVMVSHKEYLIENVFRLCLYILNNLVHDVLSSVDSHKNTDP